MAFKDLFRDKNDVNEKSIVGFVSFTIMVIFAVADLVTGYFGKDLVINDFIYNSFVIVTLGCFGIAEAGKVFSKKDEPAPRPTKHTHVHIHDEDDTQNFV
jgi:hypothetical protein